MNETEKIRDYIYHEAELIDQRKLNDWYNLFAEDALYWMPLARDQQEEDLHASLFFEDKMLLQIRVKRLDHPRAFSQAPLSHCQHVLQQPSINLHGDQGMVETTTPFVYVESQADDQVMLTGVAHHQLRPEGNSFLIYRKCIRLLNCDAALPSIQLFP